MSIAPEWHRPQRVTLGVSSQDCITAMEEWLHRDCPIDVTVKKAKTKGLRCLICDVYPIKNPSGLYWVAWVIQRCKNVKVNAKEIK